MYIGLQNILFVSWMHIMSNNVLSISTSCKAIHAGLLWILEIVFFFFFFLWYFKPRIFYNFFNWDMRNVKNSMFQLSPFWVSSAENLFLSGFGTEKFSFEIWICYRIFLPKMELNCMKCRFWSLYSLNCLIIRETYFWIYKYCLFKNSTKF